MAEHRVVGAGAVGTVLAGYLAAAGENVRLQVRPGRATDYRGATRLTVTDSNERTRVDVAAPGIDQGDGPVADYLYLTVKHHGLDSALAALGPALGPDTVVCPCLNGVDLEQRLRARLPEHRIVPITVMFNARVEAPLRARLAARPELLFHAKAALPPMARLRHAGMTVALGDAATEWGKLLINLNNAVCAVTRTGFAHLFRDPQLTRAFVTVMDEAVAALDAAGIDYDLPVPVPYRLYRWFLLHGRGLPLWVARRKNGLGDDAFPSMLDDLERGRVTEIGELNGVIVALGAEHDVPTPANAKLIELVRAREGGAGRDYLTPAELAATLGKT